MTNEDLIRGLKDQGLTDETSALLHSRANKEEISKVHTMYELGQINWAQRTRMFWKLLGRDDFKSVEHVYT